MNLSNIYDLMMNNNNTKVALITGITGQDGSYLTELLLEKEYIVFGIVRHSSSNNTHNIQHLTSDTNLHLVLGDITDTNSINNIVTNIRNKHPFMQKFEVYNLVAQSYVKLSFTMPEYTTDVNSLGTLRLLEAIRNCGIEHITRFFNASTCDLFGNTKTVPQNEETEFNPCSPYAISKMYSHYIVKHYRETYRIYACNGILFNHESPRRSTKFVTRKITKNLAEILKGERDCMYLGNVDSYRDWGHARDYVYGMWLMLQKDTPDDYILATGETHNVREFVEKAFAYKDIFITWEGKGSEEIGIDKSEGRVYVRIHKKYMRPTDIECLQGDASKAGRILYWYPYVNFDELIHEMVDYDVEKHKDD